MVHLLARGHGVEVHGGGVVMPDGRGWLFVGVSGAGKTTLSRMWCAEPDVRVLSDERIILREEGGEIWMYGTPWHGDGHIAEPGRARLDRVFFLRHGPRQRAHGCAVGVHRRAPVRLRLHPVPRRGRPRLQPGLPGRGRAARALRRAGVRSRPQRGRVRARLVAPPPQLLTSETRPDGFVQAVDDGDRWISRGHLVGSKRFQHRRRQPARRWVQAPFPRGRAQHGIGRARRRARDGRARRRARRRRRRHRSLPDVARPARPSRPADRNGRGGRCAIRAARRRVVRRRSARRGRAAPRARRQRGAGRSRVRSRHARRRARADASSSRPSARAPLLAVATRAIATRGALARDPRPPIVLSDSRTPALRAGAASPGSRWRRRCSTACTSRRRR